VFCFKCGRIIHDPKGCPVIVSKKQNYSEGAEAWGSWLRADDGYRGPGFSEGQRTRSSSPVHPDLALAEAFRRRVIQERKGVESFPRCV
jgi:hypothetical protein